MDSHLLKSTSSYSVEFNPARSKLEKDISNHEKKAKHVLRRAALADTDKLLDRDLLKDVISDSQQRWLGCLMLPVTILFFTFYSIAASLHEDVTSAHLLEAPVRNKFVPPLDEFEEPTPNMLQGVSTISDVYQFIDETYLPFLFTQTDPLGNALPKKDWGTVYQYNQIKGTVIMELQRSKKVKCTDDVASHLWCYPQDDLTNEDYGLAFSAMPGGSQSAYTSSVNGAPPILSCPMEGFSVTPCFADEDRRLEMLRDDLNNKVPAATSEEGYTYRMFFNPNSTYEGVQQRFEYLKSRGWLDDQSTRLVLKAYYLNYQMEVPRLQTFHVTFFFSRGGGIFSAINFMGFPLDTFIYGTSIMFDILFLFMLIASTAFLLKDFGKACASGAPKSHFTFVNIVTWMSVIVGWFNSLLILSSSVGRKDIVTALEEYQAAPSDALALKFSDAADSFGSYSQFMRICIAYAHLLFMIRCFTSLKWQPRLAIVTRTIRVMSSDLLHFMIVLIPTFIAFAIAGMMMFGRRLQDFSTLQSSVATCFKIAMENEFRWRDLSAQDFGTSATWVWVFVPLVVLLMLNMVLAIIMDIYQEVRREEGNTMTISRHIKYIYQAFRNRERWVGHDVLYSTVADLPQTISILELKQAFPSMPDFQGDYLVSECLNKAKKMSRCGVDTGVTAQLVAAIHVSLEEMINDINDMKRRGWMGMGFEIPHANDRETVKDILTSVSTQQHWMQLTQKSMVMLQGKIDGIAEVHEAEKHAAPEHDHSKNGSVGFKIGSE
jgi:hypothetical protein